MDALLPPVRRLPYAGETPSSRFEIRSVEAYDRAIARHGRWDAALPKELHDGAGGAAWEWSSALLAGDDDAAAGAWRRVPDRSQWAAVLVHDEHVAEPRLRQADFARRMRSTLRSARPDARRPNQPGQDGDGRPLCERLAPKGNAGEPLDPYVWLELCAARHGFESGNDEGPETDGEAAHDASEPAPKLRPMTPALRGFRTHMEQWLASHPPCWRSWTLRVLALLGARDLNRGIPDDDPEGDLDEPFELPSDIRAVQDNVERQMAEPTPKKAGQPKAWVKAAGHLLSERGRAGLAREGEAKALTTKFFGLLGVACQRGSSAEQKRAARSAEAREFTAAVEAARADTEQAKAADRGRAKPDGATSSEAVESTAEGDSKSCKPKLAKPKPASRRRKAAAPSANGGSVPHAGIATPVRPRSASRQLGTKTKRNCSVPARGG